MDFDNALRSSSRSGTFCISRKRDKSGEYECANEPDVKTAHPRSFKRYRKALSPLFDTRRKILLPHGARGLAHACDLHRKSSIWTSPNHFDEHLQIRIVWINTASTWSCRIHSDQWGDFRTYFRFQLFPFRCPVRRSLAGGLRRGGYIKRGP